MKVKTHLTIEKPVAFVSLYPPILTFITNFTASVSFIVTFMVFFMIISFLAFCTVVISRKKCSHAANHIIMIIVIEQINLLISLWTAMDYSIKMLFGQPINLITRQNLLELFYLFNTTFFQWYTSFCMELFCQLSLWFITFPNAFPFLMFV